MVSLSCPQGYGSKKQVPNICICLLFNIKIGYFKVDIAAMVIMATLKLCRYSCHRNCCNRYCHPILSGCPRALFDPHTAPLNHFKHTHIHFHSLPTLSWMKKRKHKNIIHSRNVNQCSLITIPVFTVLLFLSHYILGFLVLIVDRLR